MRFAAFVILFGLQAVPQDRELRGTATLEGGGAPAGVAAVMFPSEEARWNDPKIADVSRLAPLNGGAFVISGLPPGAYRLGFTSAAGAKEFPAPALFARLAAAGALPIDLPGTSQLEAVIAPAASDYRLVTAKVATSAVMTVPSRGTSVAPPGRGAPRGPVPPGAISGRVVDQAGEPVGGIEVRTLRPREVNGRVDYLPIGQAVVTGADGRYRAAGRAPGDYIVVVAAYALDVGPQAMRSIRRAPASTRDADGVLRGYVTSFYPSTDDHQRATRVTVAQAEVTGIDITLVRKPVHELRGRIEGQFTSTLGFPPAVTVFSADLGSAMTGNLQRRMPVDPKGEFGIPDLPEGRFVVSFSGPAGWARQDVTVSTNTPPVTLALRPPMTVTGTVDFHGDALRPEAPAPTRGIPTTAPITFIIQLASVQPEPGTSGGFQPAAPDGTFVAHVSGPGPFRLRATYPAPWIQVSGIVDDVDTLDVPLPYGAAAKDARIVMADRPTTLVLNVRDASDRPLPNVLVALFSEDERYWVPGSRRAYAGPTSPVGTATFTGLPAGRYLAVAAPELPSNAVASSVLFKRLLARATPFELALRESKAVTVQVK